MATQTATHPSSHMVNVSQGNLSPGKRSCETPSKRESSKKRATTSQQHVPQDLHSPYIEPEKDNLPNSIASARFHHETLLKQPHHDEKQLPNVKRMKEKRSQIEARFTLPPCPDEIPFQDGQRVVAIGDVHGNYKHLLGRLKVGGLIDLEGNWCGGNTILVQVGDVLDRGNKEIECMSLLCKLGRQSLKEEGRVILLWGNHERDNAEGNSNCDLYRYSGTPFHDTFGEAYHDSHVAGVSDEWSLERRARMAVFMSGGLLAHPYLSNLKVAVKVGSTVFVHGGLLQSHGSLEELNRAASEWINPSRKSSCESIVTITNRTIPRISPCILDGPESPLDMRTFSAAGQPTKEKVIALTSTLTFYNAKRLVMGHTIQAQINSAYNDQAWRIDVGNGTKKTEGRYQVFEISATLGMGNVVETAKVVSSDDNIAA